MMFNAIKNMKRKCRASKALPLFMAIIILSSIYITFPAKKALAWCCMGCNQIDCVMADPQIPQTHQTYLPLIKRGISTEFSVHKGWITYDFLIGYFIPSLQYISEKLTVAGMRYTEQIGKMYDAKIQMETQDLIRELEFQAYKDYQPSEDLCTIGTAIRSLNHTQLVAKGTASAFNASQLDRQIGKRNMSGGKSVMEDKKHRWNLFLTTYCDPRNNNWYPAAFTGLTSVCGNTGGGRTDRVNADIDYTRTIDIPRTIDIFGPAWTYEGNRKDEHDAYQLANNLYGHNVLSRNLGDSSLQDSQVADQYMSLRSVAAARNVATSSYNEIIGLKAFGSTYEELNPAVTDEFLGRILINLGIPEKEVVLYLGIDTAPGAYASTYAVLEILAKKIYQDPNFYSSLYETPENVKRKRVAMKAIGLMLDRQLFESQIRQEMAMSVLLSSRLRNHMKKTNVKIGSE